MKHTAEFVSPMHPDKICDRISGAILDEALKQDPKSRVAVETMGGHGVITITGEMATKADIDIWETINDKVYPLEGNALSTNIVTQSPEIAQGVDTGGAGDQGIMVGYACRDTDNLMPLEYELARDLCRTLYKEYPADGKTQITIENDNITSILVSWSGVSKDKIREIVNDWNDDYLTAEILINPAVDWNQSGFDADAGVTGRKIVVDAYGPRVPVGGGAFSGKDPTKVDLSAALMARKIAVETLTKDETVYESKVKVAYAIGKKEPIMITEEVTLYEFDDQINNQLVYDRTEELKERFYPQNIIKELELDKPQYEELARWGHFGNGNKWDKI